MNKLSGEMSDRDLVQRFADNCVSQDKADMEDKISVYNKLYDEMVAIVEELKKRVPDGRPALSHLYNHPNIQVRLQAARFTLSVVPDKARAVIEEIARSGWMPQAADAKGTLRNLDEGVFIPK